MLIGFLPLGDGIPNCFLRQDHCCQGGQENPIGFLPGTNVTRSRRQGIRGGLAVLAFLESNPSLNERLVHRARSHDGLPRPSPRKIVLLSMIEGRERVISVGWLRMELLWSMIGVHFL